MCVESERMIAERDDGGYFFAIKRICIKELMKWSTYC
jgi:hypothetical protein